MQKYELRGITPRAKYKSYKGDFNGTVKNLLLNKVIDTEKHKTYYTRNFATTDVNQKWTTDVSEFHIAAGKLYVSPILDYKVILINVQKILNKYVHMLSYMSCIEGAHYDNRIQCNHRFTYTVC